MDYEKIKQIIKDMEKSKLASLSIDFADGTKISMTKQEETAKCASNRNIATAEQADLEKVRERTETNQEIEGANTIIKSPIVGTFYTKPSPEADPYVAVGSVVKKGDILCIVEAMKLMNEIESEYAGEVVEILAKDGQSVEYGTPLFKIKV